jgi:hypothetical protein
MQISSHYYKCSPEYLSSISPNLEKEIKQALDKLVANKDSKALSVDLSRHLVVNGWVGSQELCKTSSSIEIETKSDLAKKFDDQLVQLEMQANDLEGIASDVIKFRIAFAEKRIRAGIEIIIQNGDTPATFETVKDMLVKLDIDCPVWLIGIS